MVNEHFLDLLRLAKAQDPDSDAVIFFDKLLKNCSIDSEFTIKDQDCHDHSNILENNSNPEIANDAIDAIKEDNLLTLMKLGMADDVNLNYDIRSQLSIAFKHQEPMRSSRYYVATIFMKYDDVVQDENDKKDKYDLIESINDILDRKATSSDLEYLGDVVACIDSVDTSYNSEDECYEIELTGFKYAIEAVLSKAVNDGEIKLDDNWKESL